MYLVALTHGMPFSLAPYELLCIVPSADDVIASVARVELHVECGMP